MKIFELISLNNIYNVIDKHAFDKLFIYARTSDKYILSYREFITYEINDIIFIATLLSNKIYSEYYFKNGAYNNFKNFAHLHIEFRNSIFTYNYYCINGKYLEYDEWLKHPEKIRFDRNEKMKNINK